MNPKLAEKLITEPGDATRDELFETETGVVWVDWKAAADDIAQAVSLAIPTRMSVDVIDERFYIHHRGENTYIPLKFEPGEQEIVLATINQVLAPKHELRLITASIGGDTEAYLPLDTAIWAELETEFGEEVGKAFATLENSAAARSAVLEASATNIYEHEDLSEEEEQHRRILQQGGGILPPPKSAEELQALVDGTPVMLAKGFKPIKDIAVGDFVLAKDSSTQYKKNQPTQVTRVERVDGETVCSIEIRNQKGDEEIIWLPRWAGVLEEDGCVGSTRDFYPDEMTLNYNRRKLTVLRVHCYETPVSICKLSFDLQTTYFVGKLGLCIYAPPRS